MNRDPLPDVRALLDTCLTRSGGVRTLAEVLTTLRPDSTATARLNDLVERPLPDPLLPRGERAQLERLVHDAPGTRSRQPAGRPSGGWVCRS